MSGIQPGFLIPVYNHGKTALPLVEKLADFGIPIILVDDGSNSETKEYLKKIVSAYKLSILVSLAKNTGKGGAIIAGLDKAHEIGITHILQIDADGQHDFSRASFFFEESAKNPSALLCGYPEYDETVPANRKNGRVIANTWSKIVTFFLSDIKDSMCGFRVYPVAITRNVTRHLFIDKRMGFDIETLVRLVWKNVPLIFYPVKVTYPKDGISHFHLIKDNIRISGVFTRLFVGMVLRLPLLLIRKSHARS
ncbi:MAG: glycosyltransferase family 2 protein [Spirochaetaceae bacterium]|jgi:glycosyltransferase involved in cell wall biosynthesis|nr:glycosyltransferase family 2 protein [Spirochaetaceae bacterium]